MNVYNSDWGRYVWWRFTSNELIYFANFVNSELQAIRLELLAKHRDLNRVAKICGVTRSCICAHIKHALRCAMSQICKMQQLDAEFGVGHNAAAQLHYFHAETRILRQRRAKQVEAELATLKAQLKAKRTELRALKR